MREEEHNLQCACVKWFAYQHPELQGLLFAVPNGGARSKATAGKLKAEGVVPGVADLILLVPVSKPCHDDAGWWYTLHGLCIEMKTKTGRQSPEQKAWAEKVMLKQYEYAVCRSLDEFMNTIENYLNAGTR